MRTRRVRVHENQEILCEILSAGDISICDGAKIPRKINDPIRTLLVRSWYRTVRLTAGTTESRNDNYGEKGCGLHAPKSG